MSAAHHAATGDTRALSSACKWADALIKAMRDEADYFKDAGKKEHPELELALVRLFRATGEQKYLDFAEKIIDSYTLSNKISDSYSCNRAEFDLMILCLLIIFLNLQRP